MIGFNQLQHLINPSPKLNTILIHASPQNISTVSHLDGINQIITKRYPRLIHNIWPQNDVKIVYALSTKWPDMG